MIISQADPGFDLSDPTRAPLRDPKTLAETDGAPDGFQPFLVRFGTRRSRSDARSPTSTATRTTSASTSRSSTRTGQRLENFTRVETFGDNAANGLNDVHWVKALVDPQSRDVFAFQAQMVPANIVAH